VLTRSDHGYAPKGPRPYGRIHEGVFLMMDDMSLDGLWDCDTESMEDGHYGG